MPSLSPARFSCSLCALSLVARRSRSALSPDRSARSLVVLAQHLASTPSLVSLAHARCRPSHCLELPRAMLCYAVLCCTVLYCVVRRCVESCCVVGDAHALPTLTHTTYTHIRIHVAVHTHAHTHTHTHTVTSLLLGSLARWVPSLTPTRFSCSLCALSLVARHVARRSRSALSPGRSARSLVVLTQHLASTPSLVSLARVLTEHARCRSSHCLECPVLCCAMLCYAVRCCTALC